MDFEGYICKQSIKTKGNFTCYTYYISRKGKDLINRKSTSPFGDTQIWLQPTPEILKLLRHKPDPVV